MSKPKIDFSEGDLVMVTQLNLHLDVDKWTKYSYDCRRPDSSYIGKTFKVESICSTYNQESMWYDEYIEIDVDLGYNKHMFLHLSEFEVVFTI